MSDETFHEAHSEEMPDEGMGTAREEWDFRPETDPMLNNDFGMSAGYPIINDEAFPDDPGKPPNEMETPPEEAMQGAPIYSDAAYELPSPLSKMGNKTLSQDQASPANSAEKEIPPTKSSTKVEISEITHGFHDPG